MNSSLQSVKTDSLTGLANREAWLAFVEQQFAKDDAHRVVLFIDLDRFKFVNDSLGHDAGDVLLKNSASILKANIDSEQDLAGRMGGDEFVVLLQAPQSIKAVESIANQIIEQIGQPVLIETTEVEIGASIGVAHFPNDSQSLDEVMKFADLAMYRAKHSGRNQVVSFNHQMVKKIEFRRDVQSRLRRLLKEKSLVPVYQAIYDTRNQQASAIELRIDASADSRLQMLDQNELFALVDESQLAIELSEWMFIQGLQYLQTLNSNDIELDMVFPVRPSHFHQKSFVDWLSEQIDYFEIAAENVVLQLSDSALNAQRFPVEKQLRLLSRLGVELAVHNFGTGHLSPLKLHDWPLTQLNLSSSFIDEMMSKKSIAAMTEALINMGHTLNKRVVAYGVMTAEQQAFLNSHQCYFMQGAIFGEAVCEEDFELEQINAIRDEDEYFKELHNLDDY